MSSAWIPKSSDEEHCNYNEAMGFEMEPYLYSYTEKDVALYALGVGVAMENPTVSSELKFVYENHVDFAPLPSFAVLPPFQCISQVVSVPGLVFNPMKLLHGEAYVEIKRPLATSGTLRNEGKIIGIYDKKKAASVVLEVRSFNENNEEVLYNRYVQFIVFLHFLSPSFVDRSSPSFYYNSSVSIFYYDYVSHPLITGFFSSPY